MVDKETAIRVIVRASIQSYASGFETRHLGERDNPEGTINMKINNVFIAALGSEIQFYSALCRSLDSSLGNMLEKMAINIAELSYKVSRHVEGTISEGQTSEIAAILERYKLHSRPQIADYAKTLPKLATGSVHVKRHESDYYLIDEVNDNHYLIELKIGGDLDVKKARAEKEALLEQYTILANTLKAPEKIKIFFATGYNRYGEGNPWRQGRVLQYFSEDELLISSQFWNFICRSEKGYEIVIDEYRRNAYLITEAINKIKTEYLD